MDDSDDESIDNFFTDEEIKLFGCGNHILNDAPDVKDIFWKIGWHQLG